MLFGFCKDDLKLIPLRIYKIKIKKIYKKRNIAWISFSYFYCFNDIHKTEKGNKEKLYFGRNPFYYEKCKLQGQ